MDLCPHNFFISGMVNLGLSVLTVSYFVCFSISEIGF